MIPRFLALAALAAFAPVAHADPSPLPEDLAVTDCIPEYQRTPPAWAISLNGTPGAFGRTALTSDFNDASIFGVSIQLEYLFPHLQKYGVLAVGPEISFFRPTGSTEMLEYPNFSLVSAGAQIRYQARFFREQVLVPTVGYHLQFLRYALSTGTTAVVAAQGPSAGLMFLLNVLEPSAASSLFATYGISRSYLTFEAQSLTAEDNTISFSGISLFFGLRFEF